MSFVASPTLRALLKTYEFAHRDRGLRGVRVVVIVQDDAALNLALDAAETSESVRDLGGMVSRSKRSITFPGGSWVLLLRERELARGVGLSADVVVGDRVSVPRTFLSMTLAGKDSMKQAFTFG